MEQTKEDRIKVSLFGALQHINDSIMVTLAMNDLMEEGVIIATSEEEEDSVKEAREELEVFTARK